ncbi:glutamine-hydrolyzing GMP synthase [Geomesophilobacter sediminis]|uniref:GMP synthase [glutamine-hydrolyzing] n=1 Tax=Geomesophilobacter sediminis TaxID=2798584 RepID=A0A8J7M2Z5_9BACT|nr:glutamine-hydrolyzing GMP synthase [Geomesophilobacter sediminis]MBJ6727745.1 glutamine-hydrolyzing GMP synthase [Geomesophilobacter sediminis]
MTVDIHSEKVLILDFGSQVTQLIARRVREQSVYCEIHPYNMALEKIKEFAPKGIILSGGPSSVYDKDAPHSDLGIYDLGVPVLGICYGMQLMTQQLGGRVERCDKREFGRATLELDGASEIFASFTGDVEVWMSHGDRIELMPEGFALMAHTTGCPTAAMKDEKRRFYGLQFHPEVVHTPRGDEMIGNFVFNICGCVPTWTMANFIETETASIREKVGNGKVLCALSGGVDSAVVAVLIHRAIGDQLHCVFVNNGLLRKGEADKVVNLFTKHFKINLHHVDATDRFLDKLSGISDPERKRKIIGNEFIYLFEEEAKKLGQVDYLAQGTLYPDVIESVSTKGPSAVIKSHHNVGGLPEKMNLKLLEPVRELFKDEVRLLGKELGMPDEVVYRQPFPGPGLAIRCIGELSKEKLDILREADAIVIEEIRKAGLYREIWQSFAVLLPVKTVGVMGDARTYEYTCALRAVNSIDGMTADWVKLPYEILGSISSRIINEVKGVNRVVYDISQKPPATIEWE